MPDSDAVLDAPLGKPRAQIVVTEAAGKLTITIPRRPTRRDSLAGILLLVPAGLYLGRTVLMVLLAVLSGAEGIYIIAAGAGGLGIGILLNLPIFLMAAIGAYLAWGHDELVFESSHASMRKGVRNTHMPWTSMQISRGVEFRADRDELGRWHVVGSPGPPVIRSGRPLRFGQGSLTRDAAETLAATIAKHYPHAPRSAHDAKGDS